MSKKKIYLKPVAGLCNRIRAIDSALQIADSLNKDLVVFWGRDRFLNCRYSDLFEPSSNFRVIEEKRFLGLKLLYPYLPGSKPHTPVRKKIYTLTSLILGIKHEIWFEEIYDALEPISDISPKNFSTIYDYEEKSYELLKPFKERMQTEKNCFICTSWRFSSEQNYVRNFIPIKHLQNIINSVTQQFSNTIGVHIRRTDHTEAIKYSSTEHFIKRMLEELKTKPTVNFFLATDCAETEALVKDLFPGKVITSQKRTLDRNSTEGIQDSLVDLYCLSKTQKVLGSYNSSFSQVSAQLGCVPEYTIYR
ncbi:hypothetical protein [Pontibacter indicus]|uniref:Glycosyl transferase family 11 n=1 Tax=Pontibacter indicus TaxID=1317125 RepID=A0A1R3XHY8_9BACT|nr:hypothetical protein [Pontibacter indicus]SIT90709.1 hypothetical protein SAMN05444128_2358 [Pontibacter indicus]